MQKYNDFWVIIPAFNEEDYIQNCLSALSEQTDKNINIVIVDNGSTDNTIRVAKQTAKRVGLKINIVEEPKKGTGWASRAGFDFAIKQGGIILARTDADCIPDKKWVQELRKEFNEGNTFVSGQVQSYSSEPFKIKLRFALIVSIIRLYIYVKRIGQKGGSNRFILSPGANLAIDAALYREIGGFSKTAIEAENEDVDLADRAVAATNRVKETHNAIVYTSVRRIYHVGLIGTLRWYGTKIGRADIR